MGIYLYCKGLCNGEESYQQLDKVSKDLMSTDLGMSEEDTLPASVLSERIVDALKRNKWDVGSSRRHAAFRILGALEFPLENDDLDVYYG